MLLSALTGCDIKTKIIIKSNKNNNNNNNNIRSMLSAVSSIHVILAIRRRLTWILIAIACSMALAWHKMPGVAQHGLELAVGEGLCLLASSFGLEPPLGRGVFLVASAALAIRSVAEGPGLLHAITQQEEI